MKNRLLPLVAALSLSTVLGTGLAQAQSAAT